MKLKCSLCGDVFSDDYISCPKCNSTLLFEYESHDYREGLLNPRFRNTSSIWRFNLLPRIDYKCIVSLGEGGTYIHKSVNLPKYFDFNGEIYLKDESRNPTGSFIDRGVSIIISHVKCRGYNEVSVISPGNLGVSVSAYSSYAGIKSHIYIPLTIEKGKLYQILMYGGETYLVRDIREGLYKILRLWDENRVYPILPNNPYYMEGIKTIAYEIAESIGIKSTDGIVVPMGSGSLIYSLWKGFKELYELGYIKELPKLFGVQIRGASPIVDAILGSEEYRDEYIPELFYIEPLNKHLAIKAIEESGGYAFKIEYSEVLNSLKDVTRLEGIFMEIASAASIASIRYVLNKFSVERIIAIVTGHGLKDPATVREIMYTLISKLGVERGLVKGLGRTKILILQAISSGYDYGYSIWKYLSLHGVKIRLPTVYQHLKELEVAGLIHISTKGGVGREVTRYRLTREGYKILKALI